MMTRVENPRPVNLPFMQDAGRLKSYLRPQRLRVCLLAGLIFGSVGLQLANRLDGIMRRPGASGAARFQRGSSQPVPG